MDISKHTDSFVKEMGIKCYKNSIYAFLSVVFLCGGCSSEQDKLQVGQTWIYKTNASNPFKAPNIYRQRIIDLKEGYVLYIENDTDTLSCSERWFLIGAEEEKNYR